MRRDLPVLKCMDCQTLNLISKNTIHHGERGSLGWLFWSKSVENPFLIFCCWVILLKLILLYMPGEEACKIHSMYLPRAFTAFTFRCNGCIPYYTTSYLLFSIAIGAHLTGSANKTGLCEVIPGQVKISTSIGGAEKTGWSVDGYQRGWSSRQEPCLWWLSLWAATRAMHWDCPFCSRQSALCCQTIAQGLLHATGGVG